MSEENALRIADEGAVRQLILNRPEKLNALDVQQHARIGKAVADASDDASVRVLVLSGDGRAFCAGDDLRAAAPAGEDLLAGRRVDLEVGPGPALLLESAATLRACPKPTVVLLHGHALGSGYDYSLSCDFRLAAEDVNYGDPRMHRALWAAEGWSYKLPRLVGQSAVAPIAYLGETMNGQQAYDAGLAHRVYPACSSGAELRDAAAPFIDALAALDGEAYARTKAQLLAAGDMGFQQALRYSP